MLITIFNYNEHVTINNLVRYLNTLATLIFPRPKFALAPGAAEP